MHMQRHNIKPNFFIFINRNLMKITKMFIEKGVAHNMFVTRGVSPNGNIKVDTFDTIRVVVWARKPAYGKFFCLFISCSYIIYFSLQC